jgi:hypothetical protein
MALEVKTTQENISPSLFYLKNKINPKETFQLVLNLERKIEKNGIKIVDLSKWLVDLF